MKKYLVFLSVVFSLLMVQTAAAELVTWNLYEVKAGTGDNTWTLTGSFTVNNVANNGDGVKDGDIAGVDINVENVEGAHFTVVDPDQSRVQQYRDWTDLYIYTNPVSEGSPYMHLVLEYAGLPTALLGTDTLPLYTGGGTGEEVILFPARDERYPIYGELVHSAVPLPPSVLLLGSGLLGLAALGRRKFRKS